MKPVYAVLLAGGQSKRCRPHKLFLPWNGKTVLEQSVENLTQSEAVQTVAVLYHRPERVSALLDHKPLHCIQGTPHFDGSIGVGIRYWLANPSLEEDAGFLVACADMPLVTTELINTLIEAYQNRNAFTDIVVPVYKNLRSFPRIFRGDYAKKIVGQGRETAAVFLRSPRTGVTQVEMETDAILQNINTLNDYYAALFL